MSKPYCQLHTTKVEGLKDRKPPIRQGIPPANRQYSIFATLYILSVPGQPGNFKNTFAMYVIKPGGLKEPIPAMIGS